ncbi:TPA: YkgJ family cysteine cluster protein [Enterobacter roggenkampii]|uniref:YkgJ family cysteine cluster protein n=1 Tax=Enterobacter TaxID=547 RepID=UPI0021CEACD0|nr:MULTISPECIES: YkgJ family cysteine cluster protein [Enterobacter]MCU6328987.1 YkgJ family cysteine cluster protein [Enterobacter quasiroggenkampii]MDI3447340.1 YkgJ family cysteine cluster protein [Enterobacter sp. V89_11]HDR2717316.1 YkgJ family cysteine cluster protein [Enterobacter roggenkampii]
MQCRSDCGACCIAPSISSPIPGMPQGKPANVRCVQLSEDNLCNIFGSTLRPRVCASLVPSLDMCAANREEALIYLIRLEEETAPCR